jgi:sugar phosphate isomerase/epimerase
MRPEQTDPGGLAEAPRRAIGTMVAYGFPDLDLGVDLAIARDLRATTLEVLPKWGTWPDPGEFRRRIADEGLTLHSAHGCWGAQSIRAARVDLGSTDAATHHGSIDDLKRCLDWLHAAGGTYLVVHPGGLSSPQEAEARREALARGLAELAEHARGAGLVACVENMPPGVHPGSRMAELAELVAEIGRPEVALALDTGHAHLTASADAETRAAGAMLRTTHVHDNSGRQDTHHPPGLGTVDWPAWARSLDEVGYRGPVILECVRHLRKFPETRSGTLLELLERLAVVSGA